MRILHTVESYPPSTGGMQEVVRQLSERLVKLGHDVTVATSFLPERESELVNGVVIKQFKISGNEVRGYKGDVKSYQNFLRTSDFDVVVNFAAQQWATDLVLPMLNEIKAKKVFVPTGFSTLYQPEYADYFVKMKHYLKEYDMNVFLSNDYRDINFARENQVEKIMVIPNGAAADEFDVSSTIDIRAQLGISKDHALILTVGSHTGVKGHREAIQIFRRAKVKHATLLIVANRMKGGCYGKCTFSAVLSRYSLAKFRDDKEIKVVSLTRPETVAAYQSADVFLFTSNIECSPLVLFEAMAAQTPFLTADVGNSVEIANWSGSGIVLATDKDKTGMSHVQISPSAKVLTNLINDYEGRVSLAQNGYYAWRNRFTWEKISEEYEKIYQQLVNI